jgi:hypothetical protein
MSGAGHPANDPAPLCGSIVGRHGGIGDGVHILRWVMLRKTQPPCCGPFGDRGGKWTINLQFWSAKGLADLL